MNTWRDRCDRAGCAGAANGRRRTASYAAPSGSHPPWGRSAWLGYYRTKMYPRSTPPDHAEYMQRLGRNLAEPGRFAAFRALTSNSHAAAEARLDDVAVPVLVVMGTGDPDFADPEVEARGLADRLGARLLLVEGAGHYPQAECPDEVAGGEPITFRCTTDGAAAVLWDLGDGPPFSEPEVTHTYDRPGAYRVTLLVWNEAGRGARAEKTVRVSDDG